MCVCVCACVDTPVNICNFLKNQFVHSECHQGDYQGAAAQGPFQLGWFHGSSYFKSRCTGCNQVHLQEVPVQSQGCSST